MTATFPIEFSVESNRPINSLAFLTPGNFDDDDPATGLEQTLRLFEYAEELGLQGGWVRQRHLEHGVASAPIFLTAAGQRTKRMELGSGVIPIGYENPFRLAEDLALADVLSGGRLQPGFSTGLPHADLLGHLVHDGDWHTYDLGHERVGRVLHHLRGDYLGGPETRIVSPGNVQRPRLQPHDPGLLQRVWYGGSNLRSIRWAAANGLHLLSGNIVAGELADDFPTAQLGLVEEFRRLSALGDGARVAIGRVIVPLDSADAATRARYRAYAASRHERTLAPQGERRTLFAPDLVGTSEQIVEWLLADPVIAATSELRLELPYEFSDVDYRQILHDVRSAVAPALGWQPAPHTTTRSTEAERTVV